MDAGPVVRVRFVTASQEDGVVNLVPFREEQHPGYISAACSLAAMVGEMQESGWSSEELAS